MRCAWKELLLILPPRLQGAVDKLSRGILQEIRLREGQPVVLVQTNGRKELEQKATQEDLHYIINAASNYSPWTAVTVAQGYITAPGGHRIGLCGQAVVRNGKMEGINHLTSLNIRIACDFPGISGNLGLRNDSILILGPPCSGKTTLLRDIIRQRSARDNIAVVDERGELFPASSVFQMGDNTDVLTGVNKPHGIEIALRTLSPDCIAVDEITAATDCDALVQAGWCGVSLLASVHAQSVDDLRHRTVYAPILASNLFRTIVVLRRDKSWFTERMTV